MKKIFKIDKTLTRQETIEKLKELRTGDYQINDFVLKILFNFGEESLLNASIPIHGGEIELEEYFKCNSKPKNALVIRYNRGVSTSFIALHSEKVTAIDTVQSELAPKIAKYFELENIQFINVKEKNQMLSQIFASDYDFIYFETGIEYEGVPPQFKKYSERIYVLNKDVEHETTESSSEHANEESTEIKKTKRKTKKETI